MGDLGLSQFRHRPQPASAVFPGSFRLEPEGDLAMSLFLSNFVHYFKQSEELPLERRRDSV